MHRTVINRLEVAPTGAQGLGARPAQHHHAATQRPLTFFRKLEFFALLGDTVEAITKEDGEKGVQVSQLLGGATQTDNLVLVISKLAGHSPELLKNSYCIWLNIPAEKALQGFGVRHFVKNV